jgi:hypothetical protein
MSGDSLGYPIEKSTASARPSLGEPHQDVLEKSKEKIVIRYSLACRREYRAQLVASASDDSIL